jgi:hypothetical protein
MERRSKPRAPRRSPIELCSTWIWPVWTLWQRLDRSAHGTLDAGPARRGAPAAGVGPPNLKQRNRLRPSDCSVSLFGK